MARSATRAPGWSVHEGRRAREDLGYDRGHALGYFEMGMQAIHDILVQKGGVTEQKSKTASLVEIRPERRLKYGASRIKIIKTRKQ